MPSSKLIESTTLDASTSGVKTFNEAIRNESGLLLKNGVLSGLVGYTSLAGITNGLNVQLSGSSNAQSLIFQSAASYSYTFPASSGTLALASDLSSYVPTSRELTINGTTYDLSANRSWTITGITGSGTSGQVPYFDGPTSLTSEAGFIYDASTNRLGVNTSVPNATISPSSFDPDSRKRSAVTPRERNHLRTPISNAEPLRPLGFAITSPTPTS